MVTSFEYRDLIAWNPYARFKNMREDWAKSDGRGAVGSCGLTDVSVSRAAIGNKGAGRPDRIGLVGYREPGMARSRRTGPPRLLQAGMLLAVLLGAAAQDGS
eukprot:1181270-Prorocentrum_minimum.AAC.2